MHREPTTPTAVTTSTPSTPPLDGSAASDRWPDGPAQPARRTAPRRRLPALLVLLAGALALLNTVSGAKDTGAETVTLAAALAAVDAGEVASASTSDRTLTLTLTLAETGRLITAPYSVTYSEKLIERLLDAGVDLDTTSTPRPSLLTSTAINLAPLLIIIAILVLFLRRGSGPLGLGKLARGRGEAVTPPADRFDQVAGCDEAVDELREVVDILRHPDRYRTLGARTPRGYLLAGPPGTGKTLLARAVAGEAGVPFFAVSGSEFVEVFVGQGAGRVRDLFARAKKHPAAIVFIDEIDAVGRSRSATGATGANVETENTLNQLLAEMDGFEQGNVIVLAATNRPDMLDGALTRAGRFDRTIPVPAPDRDGRTRLLRLYLDRHPHDDIDPAAFARRCVGMTGADIANLVNRAALDAAAMHSTRITATHLEQALATLTLGRERRSAVLTDRDRTVTAWHEAGHALTALLLPGTADPVAVSIVPRGPAGGVTWLGGSEHQMPTRSELADQLCVTLAGRAGELIGLDGEHTAGAHNDLRVATEQAEAMITQWGMGSAGLGVRDHRQIERGDIDRQIDQLLADALDRALTVLGSHQALLEATVAALLERETLSRDDLQELAAQHTERST